MNALLTLTPTQPGVGMRVKGMLQRCTMTMLGAISVFLATAPTHAQSAQLVSLDRGWGFVRGSNPNPATWHEVDIPHDFGWTDLPPRETDESTPVLAIRNGTWEFWCEGSSKKGESKRLMQDMQQREGKLKRRGTRARREQERSNCTNYI